MNDPATAPAGAPGGLRADVVWEALRDIGSHVRWMDDAESIRITSSRSEGLGTTFDCASRLGPFRVVDRMEVIEWKPGRAMTVRHVGVVRGVGRFSLRRRRHGTLFVWKEVLRFPWWLGGPVGSAVASPFFFAAEPVGALAGFGSSAGGWLRSR